MSMLKKTLISILLLWLPGRNVMAQAKVILKLDDLGSKNNMTTANPVLDALVARKVKAAIGVIASRLDSTAGVAYDKYLSATDKKGEKLFEVWHHGYDHSNVNPPDKNPEFKGTGYDFQLDHFKRGDQRIKQLLGVQMHTFGAPFNATDAVFNQVIGDDVNYTAVFFASVKPSGNKRVINLDNRVNMESATGVVNFAYFLTEYEKYKTVYTDYIVMQGHPNQWDTAKLAEFNKILDFLIAQKHEFVLPYAYSNRR